MRLLNLTPHPLAFYPADSADVAVRDRGPVLVVASSGAARVAVDEQACEPIEVSGVLLPLARTVSGPVEGLPEPVRDVVCVVSYATYQGCPDRDDLAVVDRAVRDTTGRVVGARGLAQPARPPR